MGSTTRGEGADKEKMEEGSHLIHSTLAFRKERSEEWTGTPRADSMYYGSERV